MKNFVEYILATAVGFIIGTLLLRSHIVEAIIFDGKSVYENGITYTIAWNAYDELPEVLKDKYEAMGYEMAIVDEIGNSDYGVVIGRITHGTRTIMIKDEAGSARNTVFHEFGHLLDYRQLMTDYSSTNEFKAIYEEEKENFKTIYGGYEYAISTNKEYFASAFAEYMMNPDRLKSNTPRTYNYIEKCLNN